MSTSATVAPPPPSTEGKLLSIGEVAELLGTTTRTLRYYEELGLVELVAAHRDCAAPVRPRRDRADPARA